MPDDHRSFYPGIDPGASGGLAVLDRAGSIVNVSPMMDTEKDVSDYLAEFGLRVRMATIEQVHSMPGQGELFPAHRVTHAIADALLLAEFARHRFVG